MRGVDLGRAMPDNPQFEASRQEASALLAQVQTALADRSASVSMLDESRVPAPAIELPRGCINCSYTRLVNFYVVEHWNSGARGCGDCGSYFEHTEKIVDYNLVEVITEAWEFQVIPGPQP